MSFSKDLVVPVGACVVADEVVWSAIPRPGRHQLARNGSCSFMHGWERSPGQPVGTTSRPTVPGPFA